MANTVGDIIQAHRNEIDIGEAKTQLGALQGPQRGPRQRPGGGPGGEAPGSSANLVIFAT